MTNQDFAAERVAEIINEAERAVDAAMAKVSTLVTELPGLQVQAGLNGSWAQPALQSVCAALSEMSSARASIIAAHKSLAAVERKLGITRAETPNNSKEDGDKPVRPTGIATDKVVALRA